MTEPTTAAAWGIQLSKFWTLAGQTFPVDVKLLALEATKHRFADPVGIVTPHGVSGVDGMLSRRTKKGDWCISYDQDVVMPGRINFTLAHELGHYFCHRERQIEFRCAQGAALGMLDNNDSAEFRSMEKEANTFASYLLMPAVDFRQQIYGQAVTLELLSHAAERYKTSFTATALKWLELTDEAAMLVVARDEFVSWSYTSALASKKGAWLPAGTPVPESAIDRMKMAATSSNNLGCRVAAGTWHPSLEAEESVIVSDQFDLMIFLVRYPEAKLIHHAEEAETDAFDAITSRLSGSSE